MKIKFFIQPIWQENIEEFEETINDWIVNAKIIDIKYQVNRYEKGILVFTYLSAMVMYENFPEIENA